MSNAKIHIHKLIQDSQEYGSNDEHMISRVFFDLEIDNNWHKGLYVNIKQVVGSSFDANEIEVSSPTGYKGPFNQESFQRIVRNFFLGLIGSNGSGIGFVNVTNLRMRNNQFSVSHVEEFEIANPSGGW